MAATRLLTLSLLTLFLTPTLPNPNPNPNPNFPSDLVSYGGVQFTTTAVHLPNPSLLLLEPPLHLLTPTSFSTHFSFSLSPNSTLSLLLIPTAFPHTFPNKTLENPKHLRIEFGSGRVKIRNTSISSPDLVNSKKHEAFVDYSAGSGLIRVGLGKHDLDRPFLIFPVDLIGMWREKGVLVGLESASNSSVVYSWRFRARILPKGMHSQPLDPRARMRSEPVDLRAEGRDVPCYLIVVSALMIAAGCYAFVVFMIMFFNVIFTDCEKVMEMEYVLKPVGGGYEKVGVDAENNIFGNVKC